MPRAERPLDVGDSPLLLFAADLRKLREKAGSPSYRDLSRRAHYSTGALSDAAAGRRLPSLSVTLAYVAACDGDTGAWERRWHEVNAELTSATTPRPELSAVPYVGLSAFRPEDTRWFFGRDRLVRELLNGVREHRFLGVFGASGSGKSSVLQAGLIAAEGRSDVVVFTPGAHPLEECAVHLAAFTGDSAVSVRTELAADPTHLHLRIRQAMAGRPDGVDLLVVVDQFEEVFTQCADHEERTRFIDALVFAASGPTSRARVVIGVRADYYGDCGQHPNLVAALRGAQVLVGAMSADELRQAIAEPAKRAGCVVETALVARLVSDVGSQAGVLPLVSHALRETWRRRQGITLTVEGYEAAGGIDHAVAWTAEAVYTGLDDRQRVVARQLFLRLVAVGEGNENTKRRISRRELDADDPNVAVVLEDLAVGRLLTLGDDSVEIAHEALIRHWPRLSSWLAENRTGLRLHHQLVDATDGWEALNRDSGALYRGARLALTQEWVSGDDVALTRREREFLDASLTAEAAVATAARRHARLLRQLVALLSVLLVVAGVAVVQARSAQVEADEQRTVALAEKLVSQATSMRVANPALSLQLSLAAYRLSPVASARNGLLSAFGQPYTTRVADTEPIASMVVSGRVMATESTEGSAKLWDIGDPSRPRRLGGIANTLSIALGQDGHTAVTSGAGVRLWDVTDPSSPREVARLPEQVPVTVLAIAPDGRTVVAGSPDGTVSVWDTTDPTRPHTLQWLAEHRSAVTAIEFSADGHALAVAHADGLARLWAVAGPNAITPTKVIGASPAGSTALRFSPDGRLLATAGADGNARIWEAATGRTDPVAVLGGHSGTVASVGFSPDSRYFATGGGEDKTVRLWNIANLPDPRILGVLYGHGNNVSSVSFTPDGTTLVTASLDQTVRFDGLAGLVFTNRAGPADWLAHGGRTVAVGGQAELWDITDPEAPREMRGARVDGKSALSRDGTLLATGTAGGDVRRWNVAESRELPALTGCRAKSVALSPDKHVLACADDAGVRLWDISSTDHPRALPDAPFVADAMAFSPDGRWLAVGDHIGEIRLWNVLDGRATPALTGHRGGLLKMDFSSDGRLVASAWSDKTLRLWDVADRDHPRAVTVLNVRADGASSVAFSPAGPVLASAGTDNVVRLWDVTDPVHPSTTAILSGHRNTITTLAFSQDGRKVLTAGTDNTVRMWDADVDAAAEHICAVARPGITEAEWAEYLPGLPFQPPCG